MPQLQRVSKYRTKIISTGGVGSFKVKLYNTDIVNVADGRVVLNTGGFHTSTTRNRMNQASNQFDLGYRVFQRRGNMFVSSKGDEFPFYDGITLVV
jgi:hypothetical protein